MDRTALRTEEKEKVVFEFDGFRVDPVRRLLSRDGEPVPITPKAFSILLALLERPGEVVEKKELIEKVWPGVFVTEANLTQNVFSLRKTLGERANENRYVVTVPGQGYCFAGEVRRLERSATVEVPVAADPPPAAESRSPVLSRQEGGEDGRGGAGGVEGPGEAEPLPAAVPPTVSRPPWRRLSSLAAWGMLIAAVAAGAGLFGFIRATRGPRTSPLRAGSPVRPAVAVLEFKSLSPGDDTRWLETALPEMLATELAAGEAMRVIRGETVAQAWDALAIRDPSSPGPSELKRLHDVLGADFVVAGSYVPLGGKIRLDLRVLEVPEGGTVVALAEVGTQPGLFELVSRTGARLRNSLGVAELSQRQIRETEALRPASPEAQRLYIAGLARLRAFDPPGALRPLQRAAEADPSSAVIHSALSQAWSLLGYDSEAEKEARKALDLARPLPRAERLAIEALFHKTGQQWDKASETYRSLWTFFPDDVEYGLKLAESLMYGGRGAEAAAALAALAKLPPPAGLDPRIDLMAAKNARRLSDFAAEKRAAEAAEAKGRKSGQALVVSQALIFQGDALLKMGRPREAIPLYQEAVKLAEQGGYQWGLGMALANLALGRQALGDLDGAQKAHEQALAIAQRTGSAVGISAQLFALGGLHRDRGRLAEAFSLLDQSRGWYVKMGDRLMEMRALNAAGTVLLARGDLAAARQRFERALALSQILGNRADEAQTLDNLGAVLAAQGALEEARRRHEEAASILGRAGDPGAAASALAAAAEAEARMGDPRAAWRRLELALAAKRQSGDRIGAGRILGAHAWLAYEMGDLAACRQLAGEQLQIARQTGARSLAAWALQNLGRAEFAAGRLAAARASLEEALRLNSALGEDLRAMAVRLDLAALALAAGRLQEATLLAREAASWYRARGIAGRQAQAAALLAEALARRGLEAEARKAAEEARARLDAIQDREIRTAAAVSLARFETATGHPQEALQLLRHAAAKTVRTGLYASDLEARFALGKVQRTLGIPAAGDTLAAVQKDAVARGFKRLAASAREAPPAVPRVPVSGL
ncbi:MAG TPA: tetratricopeptide repeat protein [Thermoanaerobaculia bacterium]|jgi:DNA-binding winged helix-turn-helix (wHTH) protein/tetratricopeptide (TPR) repeat protein/TolB-like protein